MLDSGLWWADSCSVPGWSGRVSLGGSIMGEYATRESDGAEVKIGTCESMYYLREDQRELVRPLPGSGFGTLYRFPFINEDTTAPGDFEDYRRAVPVPAGWSLPGGEDGYTGHGRVQFIAGNGGGWNAMLPCPLGPDGIDGVKIMRNGGRTYGVRMTKPMGDGTSRVVVECGPCGSLWSLTAEDGLALALAFIDEGIERHRIDSLHHPELAPSAYYPEMGRRIAALYGADVPATPVAGVK